MRNLETKLLDKETEYDSCKIYVCYELSYIGKKMKLDQPSDWKLKKFQSIDAVYYNLDEGSYAEVGRVSKDLLWTNNDVKCPMDHLYSAGILFPDVDKLTLVEFDQKLADVDALKSWKTGEITFKSNEETEITKEDAEVNLVETLSAIAEEKEMLEEILEETYDLDEPKYVTVEPSVDIPEETKKSTIKSTSCPTNNGLRPKFLSTEIHDITNGIIKGGIILVGATALLTVGTIYAARKPLGKAVNKITKVRKRTIK